MLRTVRKQAQKWANTLHLEWSEALHKRKPLLKNQEEHIKRQTCTKFVVWMTFCTQMFLKLHRIVLTKAEEVRSLSSLYFPYRQKLWTNEGNIIIKKIIYSSITKIKTSNEITIMCNSGSNFISTAPTTTGRRDPANQRLLTIGKFAMNCVITSVDDSILWPIPLKKS